MPSSTRAIAGPSEIPSDPIDAYHNDPASASNPLPSTSEQVAPTQPPTAKLQAASIVPPPGETSDPADPVSPVQLELSKSAEVELSEQQPQPQSNEAVILNVDAKEEPNVIHLPRRTTRSQTRAATDPPAQTSPEKPTADNDDDIDISPIKRRRCPARAAARKATEILSTEKSSDDLLQALLSEAQDDEEREQIYAKFRRDSKKRELTVAKGDSSSSSVPIRQRRNSSHKSPLKSTRGRRLRRATEESASNEENGNSLQSSDSGLVDTGRVTRRKARLANSLSKMREDKRTKSVPLPAGSLRDRITNRSQVPSTQSAENAKSTHAPTRRGKRKAFVISDDEQDHVNRKRSKRLRSKARQKQLELLDIDDDDDEEVLDGGQGDISSDNGDADYAREADEEESLHGRGEEEEGDASAEDDDDSEMDIANLVQSDDDDDSDGTDSGSNNDEDSDRSYRGRLGNRRSTRVRKAAQRADSMRIAVRQEEDEYIRNRDLGRPKIKKKKSERRKRTEPSDIFDAPSEELTVTEQKERLDYLVNQTADIARDLHKVLAETNASNAGEGGDGTETKKKEEEVFVAPNGLGCQLQPHQQEGVSWLLTLDAQGLNAILADEMGLGKTIQAVSFLASLVLSGSRGPHLVIAPKNVCDHWVDEVRRWYPGQLSIVTHFGPAEERLDKLETTLADDNFDIMVTSYEIALRDLFSKKKPDHISYHCRAALKAFRKYEFEYLVVDEAHRLKNDKAQINIAIRNFTRCSRRLLLTGTPLSNNLRELWCLMNILNPRIFSSKATFETWFSAPFENMKGKLRTIISHAEQSVIVDRLHTVLRPFFRRRERKDVCPSYTSADEVVIKCPLSMLQRALMYHFQRRATEREAGVSNILMAMRSVSNHPYTTTTSFDEGLVSDANPKLVATSGKFSFLHYALPRLVASGHRILIFSQFRSVLDYLEDLMELLSVKFGRLDGMTKSDDRLNGLADFNAEGSEISVFLLTTRAGGVGLNLQTADTVILFDSDWNPSADLQAVSRIQRIGQKKTVHILRLVTQNSIDALIVETAGHKRRTQTVAVGAGQFHTSSGAALDQRMRQKDLEALLLQLEGADYMGDIKGPEDPEEAKQAVPQTASGTEGSNNSPTSVSPANATKCSIPDSVLQEWDRLLLRPGETELKSVAGDHIWIDSTPDSGADSIPKWLAKDADLVAASRAMTSSNYASASKTYDDVFHSRARSGSFSKADRAKRACRHVLVDLSDFDSESEQEVEAKKRNGDGISDDSAMAYQEDSASESDTPTDDVDDFEFKASKKPKSKPSRVKAWTQNRSHGFGTEATQPNGGSSASAGMGTLTSGAGPNPQAVQLPPPPPIPTLPKGNPSSVPVAGAFGPHGGRLAMQRPQNPALGQSTVVADVSTPKVPKVLKQRAQSSSNFSRSPGSHDGQSRTPPALKKRKLTPTQQTATPPAPNSTNAGAADPDPWITLPLMNSQTAQVDLMNVRVPLRGAEYTEALQLSRSALLNAETGNRSVAAALCKEISSMLETCRLRNSSNTATNSQKSLEGSVPNHVTEPQTHLAQSPTSSAVPLAGMPNAPVAMGLPDGIQIVRRANNVNSPAAAMPNRKPAMPSAPRNLVPVIIDLTVPQVTFIPQPLTVPMAPVPAVARPAVPVNGNVPMREGLSGLSGVHASVPPSPVPNQIPLFASPHPAVVGNPNAGISEAARERARKLINGTPSVNAVANPLDATQGSSKAMETVASAKTSGFGVKNPVRKTAAYVRPKQPAMQQVRLERKTLLPSSLKVPSGESCGTSKEEAKASVPSSPALRARMVSLPVTTPNKLPKPVKQEPKKPMHVPVSNAATKKVQTVFKSAPGTPSAAVDPNTVAKVVTRPGRPRSIMVKPVKPMDVSTPPQVAPRASGSNSSPALSSKNQQLPATKAKIPVVNNPTVKRSGVPVDTARDGASSSVPKVGSLVVPSSESIKPDVRKQEARDVMTLEYVSSQPTVGRIVVVRRHKENLVQFGCPARSSAKISGKNVVGRTVMLLRELGVDAAKDVRLNVLLQPLAGASSVKQTPTGSARTVKSPVRSTPPAVTKSHSGRTSGANASVTPSSAGLVPAAQKMAAAPVPVATKKQTVTAAVPTAPKKSANPSASGKGVVGTHSKPHATVRGTLLTSGANAKATGASTQSVPLVASVPTAKSTGALTRPLPTVAPLPVVAPARTVVPAKVAAPPAMAASAPVHAKTKAPTNMAAPKPAKVTMAAAVHAKAKAPTNMAPPKPAKVTAAAPAVVRRAAALPENEAENSNSNSDESVKVVSTAKNVPKQSVLTRRRNSRRSMSSTVEVVDLTIDSGSESNGNPLSGNPVRSRLRSASRNRTAAKSVATNTNGQGNGASGAGSAGRRNGDRAVAAEQNKIVRGSERRANARHGGGVAGAGVAAANSASTLPTRVSANPVLFDSVTGNSNFAGLVQRLQEVTKVPDIDCLVDALLLNKGDMHAAADYVYSRVGN